MGLITLQHTKTENLRLSQYMMNYNILNEELDENIKIHKLKIFII